MEGPTVPRLPHAHQRFVGIDPGRRDMIGLVSNEGDSFTVSTKSERHIPHGMPGGQCPFSAERASLHAV